MKTLLTRPSASRLATHLIVTLVDARKAVRRWLNGNLGPQSRIPPIPRNNWEQTLPCLFHEMLNYSCTLRSNALLLRNDAASESILGPLGRMERTTEKIERLAHEVMELASVTQLTRLANLDARRMVETCVSEHFQERGASFEILVESDRLQIQGDWYKLERVFLNLFRNAFEAGARHVRIRLTGIRDRLLILVEDDGKGCPDDQVRMLFRRNYTTKREAGGSGLGLYLVAAIVEAHGGAVRAITKNSWNADEAERKRRGLIGAAPDGMGPYGTGMIFCLEFPLAGTFAWNGQAEKASA